MASLVHSWCAAIAVLCACSAAHAQPCPPQWVPQAVPLGFNGPVYALTTWDPDGAGPEPELLVFGGEFTSVAGLSANRVVAWDGIGWRTFGSGFGPDAGKSVLALTSHDGRLFAGGSFERSGGVSLPFLAEWTGTNWIAVGPAPSNIVKALASFGGDLYAGGGFSRFGGTTTRNIARWNNSAWQPVGGGLDRFFPSSCSGLQVDGASLIAVGCFDTAGPIESSNIAAWNGSTWSGFGVGINDGLCGLSASIRYEDRIIATGEFSEAGGIPALRIASWNGAAWSALGTGLSGPGVDTKPGRALATFNGEVYVGGAFITADGITTPGLGRWDTLTWHDVGGGLTFADNAGVYALAVYNDELVIAGDFNAAGGSPRQNWARWSADGRAPVIRHPAPSTLEAGDTLILSATPATEYTGVSVQWQRNGINIADGPGGASPGGGTVSGAAGTLPSPTGGEPVTLTITNIKASDAGTYTVVFSNACGDSQSDEAWVVVPCSSDYSADTTVDILDFLDFIDDFSACELQPAPCGSFGNPDVNADTTIDILDFLDFLDAFGSGC